MPLPLKILLIWCVVSILTAVVFCAILNTIKREDD